MTPKQHSELIRTALNKGRWTDNEALAALDSLEEQFEALKDNSPTIAAAYLRLMEQLEALQADVLRAASQLPEAPELALRTLLGEPDSNPASEPESA